MNTQVEMVRLSDVCDVLRGTVITKNQATSGDVPVVAGGRDAAYFTGSPNRPARMITVSGSGNAGFVNFWDVPIFASDCSTVATKDPDFVETRFLFHQLKFMEPRIMAMQQGAAQKHVYAKDVAKLQIFLPPISEQRRIAAILDKADEVRSKRKAVLETLELLSRAIFIDMFGDPIKNPMGWPLESFGGLTSNEDSLRVPVKLQDRSNRSGAYPYYGASGIIDYVDDYLFDGERLLIGEDGANLAVRSSPVAFIASGKYWVNNHAHVLRENGKSDIRFLERLIEFSDLKPFLSGSAQPKLNQANLARMMVICPPIALQRKFAEQVRMTRKTYDSLATAVVAGDCLFTSLQNNAFQGAL